MKVFLTFTLRAVKLRQFAPGKLAQFEGRENAAGAEKIIFEIASRINLGRVNTS